MPTGRLSESLLSPALVPPKSNSCVYHGLTRRKRAEGPLVGYSVIDLAACGDGSIQVLAHQFLGAVPVDVHAACQPSPHIGTPTLRRALHAAHAAG